MMDLVEGRGNQFTIFWGFIKEDYHIFGGGIGSSGRNTGIGDGFFLINY